MLLYKQLRIIKITNQIVFPNHNFFFFWEEGLATAPGLIGPGSSPGGRAPHREFPPNELRLGLLYDLYLLFDKDPALLTSPLDPYNYSNTHITQIYFFLLNQAYTIVCSKWPWACWHVPPKNICQIRYSNPVSYTDTRIRVHVALVKPFTDYNVDRSETQVHVLFCRSCVPSYFFFEQIHSTHSLPLPLTKFL